ncbi:hypothetical protein L4D08_14715 [Photobacterium chitinilyticum]|uniref:hypothetical protein n=1 Tax=Photobacterium chitinilyticum TaxID=2485123 RepID=UPI003D0D4817
MKPEDNSEEATYSLEDFQNQAFYEASLKFSEILPSNICIGVCDELAMNDVQSLKDKGLLAWDVGFKMKPFMGSVSYPEHRLLTVIYYGDGVIGRYCAGYALGCVNVDRKAVEVNFIDKRSDASEDLRYMFLPAIYEAWSTYTYALNDLFGFDINSFVLVGPVPGVRKYYIESGFTLVEDYHGSEAMVKTLY